MELQPHVLVVEDERVWQDNYRDLLHALGYNVSVVGSLDGAKEELERSVFDAFLIDVALDDNDGRNKDGLAILRLLSERREADRAIIKSGYITEELKAEINSFGPCAVLGKGAEASLDALVESLEKALARSPRLRQA